MINIGLSKHGAEVVQASSSSNELYGPNNVLNQNKQAVWCSGEGLPQHLIISLENVQVPYQSIRQICFHFQHDYETNPKLIQIWIADSEESDFIHWGDFNLKKKSGVQSLDCDQIPQSFKFLKIIIRETFGQFQTYINQISLFATLINEDQIAHEWNPTQKFQEIQHLQRNSQDQLQELSYEKNAAVLTISKNMITMEDNIQILSRKMEVLQKRVSHTYESMQKNIITKMQDMIDKKLQKQLSQRNFFQKTSHNEGRYSELGNSRDQKQTEHEKRVLGLVLQLQKKLKEREKKVKKLKLRQSRQHRY